jgi:hypothetical protein
MRKRICVIAAVVLSTAMLYSMSFGEDRVHIPRDPNAGATGLSVAWAPSVAVPAAATAAVAAKPLQGLEAVDYRRRTIYHSPQTPGFTCWCYAGIMPDQSILLGFYQATGPKDGRPRAPMDVQKKLSWPHLSDARRDMTGLRSCMVYLRSTDNGATWTKLSEDCFRSPMNGIINGMTVLGDGAVLRAVLGGYLPYDADVPRTGLCQRSDDGTKTWGKRNCFLPPDRFLAYPAGMHTLRDGRAIVIGGVSRMPADTAWADYAKIMEPLLQVSSDGGKTWSQPIQVVPDEHRKGWACEECDAAELPNGDLFWVFRRCPPEDADKPMEKRINVYWQGVMEKQGDSWKPKWAAPAPFPNVGLPNLVATREGAVLLTNANQWTADEGKTWHPVANLPAGAYYPKGIQLADGQILVFAHIGSDDPYWVVDQSIVMDSFRLKKK